MREEIRWTADRKRRGGLSGNAAMRPISSNVQMPRAFRASQLLIKVYFFNEASARERNLICPRIDRDLIEVNARSIQTIYFSHIALIKRGGGLTGFAGREEPFNCGRGAPRSARIGLPLLKSTLIKNPVGEVAWG